MDRGRSGRPQGTPGPDPLPRAKQLRTWPPGSRAAKATQSSAPHKVQPPKHRGSGAHVLPIPLPGRHTGPRSRTCRRPGVLRARSSSSRLPARGSGSKTHDRSPAREPPCCQPVRSQVRGVHFRPGSGTTGGRPRLWRASPGPRFEGGRGRSAGGSAPRGPRPLPG